MHKTLTVGDPQAAGLPLVGPYARTQEGRACPNATIGVTLAVGHPDTA